MIKKFNDILNEGEEALGASTTGIVGSGTKVGGGYEGSFVRSAGQSVGGGDSASSFGKNSNSSIDNIGDNAETKRVEPKHIFKEIARRKKKKDKKMRTYNGIGADIDSLHTSKKTSNEHMKTWTEFNKINEDGEGAAAPAGGSSGTAVGTLGNTSGMGGVVSAQPSSIPGDVAGSTKGSGDISQTLGVYNKTPSKRLKKKKNKQDKKERSYNDIGANIDNFYVTKYAEGNTTGGGRLIQNWEAFTEDKINEDYIMPIEVGKIYAYDLEEKGNFNQDLSDIYIGKNEYAFYKIGQLRKLRSLEIFYPEFRYIKSGNLVSVPLVDLKGIRGLTEDDKENVIDQLKKDKIFGDLEDGVISYYDKVEEIIGSELK